MNLRLVHFVTADLTHLGFREAGFTLHFKMKVKFSGKFSVANFFGNKASTASGISGDLNEKNSECSSEINVNSIQLKSKAAKGRNANGKKGKSSSETKKSQLSNSELNVNDLCGNVDLDIFNVSLSVHSAAVP